MISHRERVRLRPLVFALAAWTVSLLCSAPVGADAVRLLEDDAESLAARFELIDGSRHSIQLAYYWIDGDRLSCALFAALRDASRRGIRVQMLVDAYRNRIPQPLSNYLIREGVEIREYHPLRWGHLRWMAYRLHDKLMVQDGSRMIVGGRNVSGQYFGEWQENNFRDRDILVFGPAAAEAGQYFQQLWDSQHVRPVRWKRLAEPKPYHFAAASRAQQMERAASQLRLERTAGETLDQARARLAPASLLRLVGAASWTPTPTVRFLYSSRAVNADSEDITDVLLRLIHSAQRRIDIETPYLVVSERFAEALGQAATRGVPVRILTNSLATTNHVIAQAGYVNQKPELQQLGIELWEYHGQGVLHSKCFVIDDRVVIGSYNLNPRSEFFDTEVAVAVCDARLADALALRLEQRQAIAATPAAGQTASPSAPAPPQESPATRLAMLQVLRLVAPLVNRHL